MAKRDERDLIGHLKNLFVHLLKWGMATSKEK